MCKDRSRTSRRIGILTVCLLLACFMVFPTDAAAPPRPRELSENEIVKLVADLGVEDARTRSAALGRLLEQGPPALWHCRAHAQPKNWTWRKTVFELTHALQKRHGVQPITHNGLEFRPVVDLVWRIPAPGEHRDIQMAVKVTSKREKPLYFYAQDAVIPSLVGPDGEFVEGEAGRDHLNPINFWHRLNKGDTHVVSGFNVKLRRTADGKKMWLTGEEESGFCFKYTGIQPGIYYLWFACHSTAGSNDFKKDGLPIWAGNTPTPYIVVEIR